MKSHKLRDAVFRFDLNEIAQLLERGCGIDEIDEDGRTALMHAAIDGQSEISNFLIAKGAKVNVQDGQGWTALHFAIQNGHNEIAFDLLDNGALANLRDVHGNSPLFRAVFARADQTLISKLVKAGADPDAENLHGVSPRKLMKTMGITVSF